MNDKQFKLIVTLLGLIVFLLAFSFLEPIFEFLKHVLSALSFLLILAAFTIQNSWNENPKSLFFLCLAFSILIVLAFKHKTKSSVKNNEDERINSSSFTTNEAPNHEYEGIEKSHSIQNRYSISHEFSVENEYIGFEYIEKIDEKHTRIIKNSHDGNIISIKHIFSDASKNSDEFFDYMTATKAKAFNNNNEYFKSGIHIDTQSSIDDAKLLAKYFKNPYR